MNILITVDTKETKPLLQWLSLHASIDRIYVDEAIAGETTITTRHCFRDYFSDIEIAENPENIDILFKVKPDAKRYWKDLMVLVIHEIDKKFTAKIKITKGDTTYSM